MYYNLQTLRHGHLTGKEALTRDTIELHYGHLRSSESKADSGPFLFKLYSL